MRFGLPGEVVSRRQSQPIHSHNSLDTGGRILYADLDFTGALIDPLLHPAYLDATQVFTAVHYFNTVAGAAGLVMQYDGSVGTTAWTVKESIGGTFVHFNFPTGFAGDFGVLITDQSALGLVTMPFLESTQSWTGQNSFPESGILFGSLTLSAEAGAGAAVEWSDHTGHPAISLTDTAVDLTGQTADIGSTGVGNAPAAGMYALEYSIEGETGQIGALTVTLHLAWNTPNTSKTAASSAVNLVTGGEAHGVEVINSNGTGISYSVTHTGAFLGATYAVKIRVVSR